MRPAVKLELGSLTDQRPTGTHQIRSLIAEALPNLQEPVCRVVALEVERTLWEKATLLHAEHHRPADSRLPMRLARHYSDLASLWRHPARQVALADLGMLERVATFKSRFFSSAWAHYDLARVGSLGLLPEARRARALQRDYEDMALMFFETPPPFPEILAVLAEAEAEISGRATG